jgi:hypothetical protein
MALIDKVVAYYKLDETAANADAIDSHYQHLNLVQTFNSVGSAVGKVGNARSFTLNDPDALRLSNPAFNLGAEVSFSFACWCKPSTVTTTSFWYVAQRGDGSQWSLVLGNNGAGLISFEFIWFDPVSMTAQTLTSTLAVTANNWYFVAVWYDAVSNLLSLRVNTTTQTISWANGFVSGIGVFGLSTVSTLDAIHSWPGLIDEAVYCNAAFSTADVDFLWNSGNGRTYESLLVNVVVSALSPDLLPIGDQRLYYGLDQNVLPELTQVLTELIPALSGIDVVVEPTVQEVAAQTFLVDVSSSVNLTFQIIDPCEVLLPAAVGIIIAINVPLQILDQEFSFFPVEIPTGALIAPSLQILEPPWGYLAFPSIFTPHPTATPGLSHFAEVSRSSSSIIVFGSEPGPFKLNPAAVCYRRNGRSHVLHLARVKPQIVENYGLFDLLGAAVELSIREFDYHAPGSYLEIWNDIVLLSNFQPDTGNWLTSTPQIIIDTNVNQNSSGLFSATSFTPPRDIHS